MRSLHDLSELENYIKEFPSAKVITDTPKALTADAKEATFRNRLYWIRRENELENFRNKSDSLFNAKLADEYQSMADDLWKEQTEWLLKNNEGGMVTLGNVTKQIPLQDYKRAQKDLQAFLNESWQTGKSKEFMAAYDLAHRNTELELMNIQLGKVMAKHGVNLDSMIQEKMIQNYANEVAMHAKTMGIKIPKIDEGMIKSLVQNKFVGQTFSDRLWNHQAELGNRLNAAMRDTLMRGLNITQARARLVPLLDKSVKNKLAAVDRLYNTEMQRVRARAAVNNAKDAGFKNMMWHAESGACEMCMPYDEHTFAIKTVETIDVSSPIIPQHPNCRCSWFGTNEDNPMDYSLAEDVVDSIDPKSRNSKGPKSNSGASKGYNGSRGKTPKYRNDRRELRTKFAADKAYEAKFKFLRNRFENGIGDGIETKIKMIKFNSKSFEHIFNRHEIAANSPKKITNIIETIKKPDFIMDSYDVENRMNKAFVKKIDGEYRLVLIDKKSNVLTSYTKTLRQMETQFKNKKGVVTHGTKDF
ncbi:hypothetical protein EQG49_02350 [Periweissella cryptocerci]|uniref:Phage head morphogenesis domain-containing protein n=1 Tax=Periweissella cryptocerci TaxID=2506420 RepID=A0A4P6YRU7_9LACO|nr:hypothetical protein [Periweissella cryptocerci]QBO35388.1 hypothetical protein EQG49_02350 [Periweissella cryptocerci]